MHDIEKVSVRFL
ncbi:Protein of unknown function [Bacillus cereus]|nr:Protein of unknown function [Bacillus cereus]